MNTIVESLGSPALEKAVAEFNTAFADTFRLPFEAPLDPRDVETMATYAEHRGRPELAAALRQTLPPQPAALTAAQHNAFPKGRWS